MLNSLLNGNVALLKDQRATLNLALDIHAVLAGPTPSTGQESAPVAEGILHEFNSLLTEGGRVQKELHDVLTAILALVTE